MLPYLLFFTIIFSTNATTFQLEERNLVVIRGPIYQETTNKFFSDLKDFHGDELFIFINSPGGSVIEGMKIIDNIKTLRYNNVKVKCIADFAASMAFVILQSCEYRYTISSGILMQHQMSLDVGGNLFNIRTYMDMIDKININLDIIQANRLNMDYDEFVRKITNDWWISSFTAKEDNVVDDIVMITCHDTLYKGITEVKLDYIFGEVSIVFSMCPLIRNPLVITYSSEQAISKQEIYQLFNSDSYISNEKQIRTWL